MKISTKGRYGARAMLSLANHYGEGPIRATEIAKEQDISQKYLESILSILKSAGLLTVKRGYAGGYILSRSPEDITLYDVLAPLEDFLGIVHCTSQECECDRFEECLTRKVWQELKDVTEQILKQNTLASMLKENSMGSELIAG